MLKSTTFNVCMNIVPGESIDEIFSINPIREVDTVDSLIPMYDC